MTGKRIGYIRVSTADQNPERQLEGVALDKRFIDYASAASMDRPQLELMIEFIREDDVVFVHSMDRMARNLRDLHSLLDRIVSKKVSIHFMKENLVFNNMSNALSNLMLALMGAFAEFELSLLKERQREGIAIAKAHGKFKGGHKKLTAEQQEGLKSYVKDYKTKAQIAFELGVSVETLYKYFQRLGIDYHSNKPKGRPRKIKNEDSDYRDPRSWQNNDVVLVGSTKQEGREERQDSAGSGSQLSISAQRRDESRGLLMDLSRASTQGIGS